MLAALAETDGPLSALVAEHDPYPSSGEINSLVRDSGAALDRVREQSTSLRAAQIDELDGLTVVHWDEDLDPEDRWWFSLRSSNTEPLLRLNVEAGERTTMARIRDEILAIARDEDDADRRGRAQKPSSFLPEPAVPMFPAGCARACAVPTAAESCGTSRRLFSARTAPVGTRSRAGSRC